MSAKQRTAIYGLAGAIGALLVAVGLLDPDLLGPVLAVVSGALTVAGSFVAVRNITPDEDPDA